MTTNNTASFVPRRGVFATFFGRSGTAIAVAVLLFTALIWLRLRLVTDVPRQAYAEPKPQDQQQSGGEAERVLGPAERPSLGDH